MPRSSVFRSRSATTTTTTPAGTTPPRRPPAATADSSIRRGAAMIRHEITKQFGMPCSSVASHETDFSDVWNPPSSGLKNVHSTPPRMSPPSHHHRAQQPLNNESLEYSLESSTIGTGPEDDMRTFASRGDASAWAKGSVLVSPESPPPSPPSTPEARLIKSRKQRVKEDQENSYDFIEQDYVEEFELDDYDEVCHPLYSRQQRPALRRTQTPPVSHPPAVMKAPKKRPKTPSEKNSKDKTNSPTSVTTSNSPTTAVFDECRQGPPSPDGSMTSSSNFHSYTEVPSPLGFDYDMLLQDPAFLHAQRAGHVWQSLVGHHIRFPSRWWNGARAPPLGMDIDAPWQYLGRFACRDKRLRRSGFCKNRAAPGRLLLHIVMLDLVTCQPLQDICVGCFHPSARGIRTTVQANPAWEGVRDLWLAVRKRKPGAVSVMDEHLAVTTPTSSPLGDHQKVTNLNVRAVFGEAPPVETLFVPESYLYELYVAATARQQSNDHALPPPLVLLKEFVFA